MRVTNALFYSNAINDYQRNMQDLYRVNTQLSSGMKIQNSFEDSGVFVDTMRLDYEVATLEQAKESSSKAQTQANNTDKTLNQFTDALSTFKTKLIQAANESNSTTSLNALADELDALKTHMISLGNTSINGQYLFSGTSSAVKPVDGAGNYHGNDGNKEALIGSGVKLPYNITGQDLFLGRDSDYHKTLSTNVKMLNQTELHPVDGQPKEVYLKESDTIGDMVGSDPDSTNNPNSVFYLSGRKADGDTFSTKFSLSSTSKISDLLDRIGQEYGNSSTNKVVDVQMNDNGQIEIKDLKSGNALLEMNIFGAVDRDAVSGDGNADQADIDSLLASPNVDIVSFSKSNFKTVVSADTITSREDIYNPGTFRIGYPLQNSDGSDVKNTTLLSDFMPTNVNNVLVGATSFVIAGQTVQDLMSAIEVEYGLSVGSTRIENGQIIASDPTGNLNATLVARDIANTPIESFSIPDGMNYERRGFEKDGNTLTSNISQIVKDTNEYATNSTKLLDVSGKKTFDDTAVVGDETIFNLIGIDSSGNSFNAQLELTNDTVNGTRFTLDNGATYYTIYDTNGNPTKADDITYQQLNDAISMITSNNLPTDTNGTAGIQFDEYNSALISAKGVVEVDLDYKGRLQIHDNFNSESQIEFSMFDQNADKSTQASALTFMANDAVKIDDPNIDFYKDLDNMIEAVRGGTFRMDGDSDNPRNIGIQNSIQRIDHLMDHVTKEHTKIGSYSNALSRANERSELLSINVQTVRSEVIDVDMGEAYMKFNQLSTSYEASLSTVAKINSMSLLNYM